LRGVAAIYYEVRASVVHQDTETSKSLDRLLNDRGPLFFICDVMRNETSASTGRVNRPRHRVACLDITVSKNPRCAVFIKQLRCRRAEAFRGTTDNRNYFPRVS
jgi:hypothetical protein